VDYRKFETETYDHIVRTKIKILKPLLRFLQKHKISPNFISFLSLISGLSTIPLMYTQPKFMYLGIIGHIIFDGLDGALARFLKLNSNKGKIIDLVVGNIVISTFYIFLGITNYLSLTAALVFTMTNLVTEIISVKYYSTKTKIQSGGACHFAKTILTTLILISITFELNWNLETLTSVSSIYLSLLGIGLVLFKIQRK
jgi:phosphatidylglycerophosphate synthase